MFSYRKIKSRSNYLRLAIIFAILFFVIANIIYKSLDLNSSELRTCSQLCPYSSRLQNESIEFDASHYIRHFPNFVCPQNFRNLADWIYGWPDQFNEHIEQTTNRGKSIAPCLPPGSIIYVRIWVISEFFNDVYPYLQNDFVLVTGEGDLSSPIHLEYLERSDSKIIHWFGQNGQYDVSKIKKFTHIPIGINCFEMADVIENIYAKQRDHTLPAVFNDLDEPSSYIQPQDISHHVQNIKIQTKNLVLINFDPGTDRTGLRSTIWRKLCMAKAQLKYKFVTCLTKDDGVQIHNLPKIYQRNRQYPFWLSPRGNGLDCHRTWEALYLDIIPIVWNSSLNVLYENLPVLIINDYQVLNEEFLYEKLNEISKNKLSKSNAYQYEKLRHAYWRRMILDKSRHGKKRDIYFRKEQCWRAKSTINWRKLVHYLI